jgi:ubiquinone/menaquinone biosynthesis C-methylase UbiE
MTGQAGEEGNRDAEHTAGPDHERQEPAGKFLDIGTGLPTADNTHHVAQRVAAESRIVYVDHDPSRPRHARAASPLPPGEPVRLTGS